MDKKQILAVCDHTLLLQTSTWEEIKGICDDAMKYETAAVCIPPCYVTQAAEYTGKNQGLHRNRISERKYDDRNKGF